MDFIHRNNGDFAELKHLEFHAIWDIGIFYRQFSDKVEGFTQYQSIYLSRWLEFRKYKGFGVYLVCIALWRFLILMQYLFLEKQNNGDFGF